MRRRLARGLGVLALGWLGSPVWAQTPEPPSGLPQPTPVTVVVETGAGPTPTKAETKNAADAKAAGTEAGTKILAESTTCRPGHGFLGHQLFGSGLHGLFNHGCGHGCGGHWSAGGGIYYIYPVFETNPAFQLATAGAAVVSGRQQDFRWSGEVAPLGWVAYEGCAGLGVRGRWFQLEGSANEAFVNDGTNVVFPASPLGVTLGLPFGAAAGTYNFQSELNLYVWDLEATKRVDCGCWSTLLSAGARYVHSSQNYRATGPVPVGQGFAGAVAAATVNGSVTSGHNFDGFGPTVSVEGKRQLGVHGLALYGNARGSLLFGTAKQVASAALSNPATGAAIFTTAASARQADVLPIGEVEAGIEYSCNVGCHARMFAQAGFVGQVWYGGGNAANVSVFNGGADNASNFGLIGGALRVGFSF